MDLARSVAILRALHTPLTGPCLHDSSPYQNGLNIQTRVHAMRLYNCGTPLELSYLFYSSSEQGEQNISQAVVLSCVVANSRLLLREKSMCLYIGSIR